MTQDTVRQIEESIERYKTYVELDKALERLESNRDFKTVISDGYLKDEAVRLVHLRADPAMQTPERQASLMTSIDAIGGLLGYFRVVQQNATMAQRSIADAEAQLEEIRNEGGDA